MADIALLSDPEGTRVEIEAIEGRDSTTSTESTSVRFEGRPPVSVRGDEEAIWTSYPVRAVFNKGNESTARALVDLFKLAYASPDNRLLWRPGDKLAYLHRAELGEVGTVESWTPAVRQGSGITQVDFTLETRDPAGAVL